MRKTRTSSKRMARRRQRDVLRDVMLSAKECETWLTLDELAKLTHYPPASISAQLRHLRKPEHGGFVVQKRCRHAGKVLRGEDFGAVWEYRLTRGVRRIWIGARAAAPGANVVACRCALNGFLGIGLDGEFAEEP
jgi:hypothetical protein